MVWPGQERTRYNIDISEQTLLSIDSPVDLSLQGGDTGAATANGNITASGFGTTKIDDFDIVPAAVRSPCMMPDARSVHGWN